MNFIIILFCIVLINTNNFVLKSNCNYQPESSSSSNVYRFDPVLLIEEPPIGTLVFDLASKLDINDLATSNYKFKFYSPNSITAHYFLIDQLTGQLKTQRRLDREYLCETKVCGPCNGNSNCSLSIEIVAVSANSLNKNSKQQQKFVSFDVIVEDKNEFAPQFPRSFLVLNLSEGAPPNFNIPLDPAIDRDSGQTQIIYSISPVLNTNKKYSALNDAESLDENNDHLYLDIENQEYQAELKKLNSRIKLESSSSFHPIQSLSSSNSFNDQKLNLIIVEPFDYEVEKEVIIITKNLKVLFFSINFYFYLFS